jgi:hypothetical protein
MIYLLDDCMGTKETADSDDYFQAARRILFPEMLVNSWLSGQ